MDAEQNLQYYQTHLSEMGRLRFPYEKEDSFYTAVSQGDADKAWKIMEEALGFPVREANASERFQELMETAAGIMSRSEKKQLEYAVVIIVTMIGRAAIRGGLNSHLAMNITDLYLQQISDAPGPESYWPIMLNALSGFLEEMKKLLTTQTRSMHVLHVKQYVGQNLNKPISLKVIAEALGLSQSYLSTIFTQIEGIGVREYILKERIEAAKHLLTYSDTPIGSVAVYTGFCTQSHFGKIFKQHIGMTPLSFRNATQK